MHQLRSTLTLNLMFVWLDFIQIPILRMMFDHFRWHFDEPRFLMYMTFFASSQFFLGSVTKFYYSWDKIIGRFCVRYRIPGFSSIFFRPMSGKMSTIISTNCIWFRNAFWCQSCFSYFAELDELAQFNLSQSRLLKDFVRVSLTVGSVVQWLRYLALGLYVGGSKLTKVLFSF